MKTPGNGNSRDSISSKNTRRIIKKMREREKSESYYYDLIWINSSVTGIKVQRSTCNYLLSQLKPWESLPIRIRKMIADDILDFMSGQTLPVQKDVENEINAHPIVILYINGTMPPESDQQHAEEAQEIMQRKSDIEQLRIRTANELQFVRENMEAQKERFWNDETPTMPKRESLQIRPYSESFYRSYLGIDGEKDER